jgi:hypothetical protein
MGNIIFKNAHWRGDHLYTLDPFLVFNRHFFLPFISIILIFFIIASQIYKICPNIKSIKFAERLLVYFCVVQLIFSLLFIRVYPEFTAAQVSPKPSTSASEILLLPIWPITAQELLSKYPAAIGLFPEWSINCYVESDASQGKLTVIRHPFATTGDPVPVAPKSLIEVAPQTDTAHLRFVTVILDEALGACADLRLQDKAGGGVWTGRREDENSRFILFSITPPITTNRGNFSMELRCSSLKASGDYLMFYTY